MKSLIGVLMGVIILCSLIFGTLSLALSKDNHTNPSPYSKSTPYYNTEHAMFVFTGSYREIGRKYAAAIPMSENLLMAKIYIQNLDDHKRKELMRRINTAKNMLITFHPALYQMINGVLDVYNEHTMEEIILLSFITVLTNWGSSGSCGSVGFLVNGKPVIGQNLDLGRSNSFTVAYMLPDHGLAYWTHVDPGFPWFTVGINEAGFCISGASVNSNKKDDHHDVLFPYELISNYLLAQARDVHSAYNLLEKLPPRGPISDGMNLMTADSTGAIRLFEISSERIIQIDKKTYPIITTNHYTSTALKHLNRNDKKTLFLLENSLERYHYAKEYFIKNDLNADNLRILLRETGKEGRWCREDIEPDIGYTSASYIFNLDRKQFEYWIGIPESNPVHHILSLKALFGRTIIPTNSP